MSKIKHLFEISKQWTQSFLMGEPFEYEDFYNTFSDKDKETIENKLHDKSYWSKRNAFLENIDVSKEWENLEEKINVKKKQFHIYKYAAVITVILGVSSFFLLIDKSDDLNTPTKIETKIVAGSDKATLTLDDGKQVVLNTDKTYKNKYASAEKNKLHYNNTSSDSVKTLTYNYLTIPKGGQFQIELSDGTLVWLNSESKLKYPVHFISGQTREVELIYGEAYFEVSHSSKHNGDHYSVITNNQTVEVLGTKFNIRAYKEENIYTTLTQGSIAISKEEQREILSPGEQAINSKNSKLVIKQVDTDYEIAWKNGLFMFEQEPLYKMMIKLSRWYDMEFVFENEQKRMYNFSGVLNREDDVIKLLKTLEKTKEVTFEIQGNMIIIK